MYGITYQLIVYMLVVLILGGCPFNGRLCVFEISPRNTGTIFADCPAI